jgi:3-deoxy-manno-octulosonate cytidylyltransferase (CMP-KDO synthetase)
MKACIIIPARLGSSRLPNKVLAEINGKPMILRVFEACKKCEGIDVFVATDSEKVVNIIENAGGKAFLTDPNLPSGTDRIFSAFNQIQNANYDAIINVQGDVPNISTDVIMQTLELLSKIPEASITTPVVKIENKSEAEKSNIVKAIISKRGESFGKALYFTRTLAPFGEGDLFEHIGLYAYRKEALKKFVSLAPSPLELREKLEQLRAIENDMAIFTPIVSFKPISVDVEEDLVRANKEIF